MERDPRVESAADALLHPRAAELDLDVDGRRIAASLRSRLFGAKKETVKIGRFVLLGSIGVGGMGIVYAARDEELNRKVAVKLMHADVADADAEQARLTAEAQALARLSHPNVVQVYEVGTYEGRVYVAMEFLPGLTLEAWAREEKRPWRSVVDKYLEAGEGLVAAHAVGMIHRDLKPANLLLGADGRVRVVDFGLARQLEQVDADEDGPSGSHAIAALASSTALSGTPAYMSPEQVRGRVVDARSDQYSFCVALYEGLFGQRPHEGSTAPAVLVQIARGRVITPPRNTGVPSWIVRTIMRGLSRNPDDRFADMRTLLAELRRDPWTRRWQVLGAAALAGLMGIAVWPRVAEDRCSGVADAGNDTWGTVIRDEAHAAFLSTQLPSASAIWTKVDDRLGAWVDQWASARLTTCEAHHVDQAQSAELHDLRVTCLDRKLTEVAAFVRAFRSADAGVVHNALRGIAELPDVRDCDDAEVLRDGGDVPDDPRVKQIEEGLASATAAYAIGRTAAARAELDRVVGLSEALDYGPLLARALYERARLVSRLGDYMAALDWLQRAADVAEAAGDNRRLADVWVLLSYMAAKHARIELLDRVLRRAEASVARIGGDPLASARLLFARANRARWVRDRERAVELGREAVADVAALLDERDPERLRIETSFAAILARSGRVEEALGVYEQTLEKREALLGVGHPELARDHANIGLSLKVLGRPDEARSAYGAALDLRRDDSNEFELAVIDAHIGIQAIEVARSKQQPVPGDIDLFGDEIWFHRRAAYELGATIPRTDWRWIAVNGWRAADLRERGRLEASIAVLNSTIAAMEEAGQQPKLNYPRLRWVRASSLLDAGKLSEARSEALAVIEFLEADAPVVDAGRAEFLAQTTSIVRQIDQLRLDRSPL